MPPTTALDAAPPSRIVVTFATAREAGMKGEPKVIDYLNDALRHELTAVNQYWLHYCSTTGE
jgi:hypothetical protein